MHEYSIVQALLERVEAEAAARGAVAVERVVVQIGELSGVEIELLATAYDTFRERTICERAPLVSGTSKVTQPSSQADMFSTCRALESAPVSSLAVTA